MGNIKGGCQGKQIETQVIPHHGRALKALSKGNLPSWLQLGWQSWLFPAQSVGVCWPFPVLCDNCVWMGLQDTAQKCLQQKIGQCWDRYCSQRKLPEGSREGFVCGLKKAPGAVKCHRDSGPQTSCGFVFPLPVPATTSAVSPKMWL